MLSFFGWAGLARSSAARCCRCASVSSSGRRVLGVPTRQVLFKELLPNLVAPIVVSASLALPGYVVAEAA